jgi:hypothetical protein
MQNLRPMLAGLVLLWGSAILCAKPQVGRIQDVVDFPGTEKVIGKVWFNVAREQEGRVYFKPLLTPTLGMGRLKGSDNPELGLVQCTIVKRAAIVSPNVILNVTKALCPNNREYVVDEVIFDVDAKAYAHEEKK